MIISIYPKVGQGPLFQIMLLAKVRRRESSLPKTVAKVQNCNCILRLY